MDAITDGLEIPRRKIIKAAAKAAGRAAAYAVVQNEPAAEAIRAEVGKLLAEMVASGELREVILAAVKDAVTRATDMHAASHIRKLVDVETADLGPAMRTALERQIRKLMEGT
jgi:hypothetical protein